jgi:hypothetical protein
MTRFKPGKTPEKVRWMQKSYIKTKNIKAMLDLSETLYFYVDLGASVNLQSVFRPGRVRMLRC